jgi:Holliday junction DNA helicase RuvB
MTLDQEEQKVERALRPQTFDDYIGQDSLKERLKVAITAAKERGDPLTHCIISGSSGFGKSTIAQVIANEYGAECKTVMAPSIKSVADILEILTKLKQNSILFIDEIHALNIKVEESLYGATEDFKVSIRVANKDIVHVKVKPFCLLAATTEIGKVSPPLRNRFGIIHTLEDYTDEQLASIIKANTKKLHLDVEDESIYLKIAKRSRGIPRLANRLIYRIRDYVQIYNGNKISDEFLKIAMELEGIDDNGYTKSDINYLRSLYKNFNAGPAGLISIASSINEDEIFVEQAIEPMLLKNGLIVKTKTGRMLTREGLEYIL